MYTMYRANKFFGTDKHVLKDVSLSFLPGAKIGVLGLNGAGKSTLLRIMAGVEEVSNGIAEPAPNLRIGLEPLRIFCRDGGSANDHKNCAGPLPPRPLRRSAVRSNY